MDEARLLSPADKSKMPTLDTPVKPDEAYNKLLQWWPSEDDTDKLQQKQGQFLKMAHFTEEKDTLLEYFKEVESKRYALYASDAVQVDGLTARVAKMAGNLEHKPGAPDHREAHAQQEATYTPAQSAAGAASPPDAPAPSNFTRFEVFMYNDPLINYYYDVSEGNVSKKRASPDRSHVFDRETASEANLDVSRSLYVRIQDGEEMGLPVLPDYWPPCAVGNLVRKAAFANRLTADVKYPSDRAVDLSRALVDGGKTLVDKLIEKYKGDGEFELRVRQAQALRYAAQWARTQLSEQRSGDAVTSRMLVRKLFDATTRAIDEVEALKQKGGGAAVAASFTDLCL